MIEVVGEYNKANIHIDVVDPTTYAQVLEMCNLPQLEGSYIEIMPDCHAGAGCVIGTTIQFEKGKPINPLYVGVDIGCSVLVAPLPKEDFDLDYMSKHLPSIDNFIDWHIPHGFNVHENENQLISGYLNGLYCKPHLKNESRLMCSAGTLGGGKLIASVQVNSL